MTISLFFRKLIRMLKRNTKKVFLKQKILKDKINTLKYQINYLSTHIPPEEITPATGFIRDFQLKEINFMKELIEQLNDANIFPVLDGGGVLGIMRHNGFIPWDDDLDFNLMRDDFDKLIEFAKNHWEWIEINKTEDYWAIYYDAAIRKNPNKIIAIRTPFCLHVYRGTCLRDSVNIEFFMLDYINDNVTNEQILSYKNKLYNYLHKKGNNIKKTLEFYDKELQNSEIFTKVKKNRIYFGIGNWALTEYSFHGFFEYTDIFPPKDCIFEGVKIQIPNNPEKFLTCVYGDWKKLPSDIGISQTVEKMNEYFREYGMEEINYREE